MITDIEKQSLAQKLRDVADEITNAADGMTEIADSLDPPEIDVETAARMEFAGCPGGLCDD